MLTDEECNEFRRLPMSFNDMVRAIFCAGGKHALVDAANKFDGTTGYNWTAADGYANAFDIASELRYMATEVPNVELRGCAAFAQSRLSVGLGCNKAKLRQRALDEGNIIFDTLIISCPLRYDYTESLCG